MFILVTDHIGIVPWGNCWLRLSHGWNTDRTRINAMSATIIPGVPDDEIETLHWSSGGGKGAIGFRHLPSGIEVYRECPPGIPVLTVLNNAFTEFVERLTNAGLVADSKKDSVR